MNRLLFFVLTGCMLQALAGNSLSAQELNGDQPGVDLFEAKTELEIWQIFLDSCENSQANKCKDNRMLLVMDGGVYEDDEYDPETAFRDREEMIQAAKAVIDMDHSY